MGRWANQEHDNERDDRATERDHRGFEPTAQPGAVGPRPDPPGLRRQGRHTPHYPDRVHLERLGDRHVHDEERPEAAGPAQEPDGYADDRHRGAPAQDLAHPRSGRAGRRRWHSGRVSPDERHLQADARVGWIAHASTPPRCASFSSDWKAQQPDRAPIPPGDARLWRPAVWRLGSGGWILEAAEEVIGGDDIEVAQVLDL